MILLPDPRILTPDYLRRNRRRMGSLLMGGCCCSAYSRWRKCGSLTGEIYTRDSDAAPNPFLWIADGTCWSRVSTGQALPGGATLLEPADWTTDAGCCYCPSCDIPSPAGLAATITFSGIVLECLPKLVSGVCEPDFPNMHRWSPWPSAAYFPDPNDSFVVTSCGGTVAGAEVTELLASAFTYVPELACSSPSSAPSMTGKTLVAYLFKECPNEWLIWGGYGRVTETHIPNLGVGFFYARKSWTADTCFDDFVVSNTIGSGTATVTFS